MSVSSDRCSETDREGAHDIDETSVHLRETFVFDWSEEIQDALILDEIAGKFRSGDPIVQVISNPLYFLLSSMATSGPRFYPSTIGI